MSEDTSIPAPVDLLHAPEGETREQQRERLTKLREKLKDEREGREVQLAIASGLVHFFTWIKIPVKSFFLWHAFPNRDQRRRNLAVTSATIRGFKAVKKAVGGTKTTLRQKRAANALLVAAKATQEVIDLRGPND